MGPILIFLKFMDKGPKIKPKFSFKKYLIKMKIKLIKSVSWVSSTLMNLKYYLNKQWVLL